MDCGWWDDVGALCSTAERGSMKGNVVGATNTVVATSFDSVPSCLSGAFSELQLKLSNCNDQRIREAILCDIYGDVSGSGRDIIQTASPLVTHIAHSAETLLTKRRNRLDILFGNYLPQNAPSSQETDVNNRQELSAATDDIADFVHLFRCVQNLCTVYTQYVSFATISSDVENRKTVNEPSSDPTNDVLTFDGQPATGTHKSESEVDKSNRDTSTAYLRPFTTPFIDSVNSITEIMSKLIGTSVIPALEVSPVPYTVSTKEWVCLINSAYAAREAFSGLLNTINSLSEAPRYHSSDSSGGLMAEINKLTQVLTQFDHALSETRDRTVLALCDVYDVMVVDSVNRQEWGSHNAYQRDKKVSHGTVYITTSVRATMYDLMYHCGTTIICASEGNSNESNKDSGYSNYTDTVVYITLQLLLASLSIVTRTYFLLSPSRVRLFQWRIDLCHMLYCTLDTLSQLARYKVKESGLHQQQQQQQSQSCLMDLDSLFSGDDEQFLMNELYNIVQYLIISVSLVTQPAVENDTMVDSLRDILLNSVNSTERASEGITTAADDAVSGRNSDCYATLTRLLSLFKSLNPLLSSVVDHMFCVDTLSAPVNSPRYDLTADTNAYCGFTHCSPGENHNSEDSRPSGGDTTVDVKQLIHCVSDAERELYDKEANLKRDNQWAGARGVVFQRIVTMMTGCDSTALLRELVASPRRLRAFLDLHQQLCYVEPSMSERVKETSAIAAEKKLGRYFSVMLSRRFEVIESDYPKLTEEQIENASRVVLFINDFADA